MIKINSPSAKREAMQYLSSITEHDGYIFYLEPVTQKSLTASQRAYAHVLIGLIAKEIGESPSTTKTRIKDKLPFAYTSENKKAVEWVLNVVNWVIDFLAKIFPEIANHKPRIIGVVMDRIKDAPLKERSSEGYTREEYSQFIEECIIECADLNIKRPQPNYDL